MHNSIGQTSEYEMLMFSAYRKNDKRNCVQIAHEFNNKQTILWLPVNQNIPSAFP